MDVVKSELTGSHLLDYSFSFLGEIKHSRDTSSGTWMAKTELGWVKQEGIMGKEAKHVVRLGAEDRERLQVLIRKGSASASVLKRAHVLLKADASPQGPGWSDERIAEFAGVGLSTVHRVRQRFVEKGLAAAVPRKNRQYQKLNRKQEARLIVLARGPAPKGHDRWSLRLLADQLVALGVVDAISHESVRKTLKEANITIA